MTGAETDRGHVPFAVLGVLVLVTSIALASSVHHPTTSEVDVDREMERITAETQTTLREATLAATHDAARNPVVEPAETVTGNVLREDRAFEDALRLRIYVQIRERLDALESEQDGLTVRASVPATQTEEELRAARDRVQLRQSGKSDDELSVRVDGVNLTAERNGRLVAERTISPELVVKSPVLAVHDRVETFEGEIAGGMFDEGLGKGLTARLYPIAWARGYAQYGGAPIERVIGNRHVGLATNSALLDIQTETFGDSDPVGRETLRRTTAEVGLTDFLTGTNHSVTDHLLDARDVAGWEQTPEDSLGTLEPDTTHPSPDDEVTHGINETASSVFLKFIERGDWEWKVSQLDRADGTTLNETIRKTHHETVRVDVDVEKQDRDHHRVGRPDPDWEYVDSSVETEVEVFGRVGPPPEPPEDWHTLQHYPREVHHVERKTVAWEVGNETRTTTVIETEKFEVDVSLIGTFHGPAPDRPVADPLDSGGPFADPNGENIVEELERWYIEERGGPDEIATQAVDGNAGTTTGDRTREHPPALHSWIYPDLAELRTTIENITTTTTRGDVATYETNVPRELHDKLQDRREALIDAPETYDNVSHRARVGARAAYVDRVAEELAAQADQHGSNRGSLAAELVDRFDTDIDNPLDRLQRGIALEPSRPTPENSEITMRVETDPSYLPRAGVDNDILPTLPDTRKEYPLVVRNVNAVSAPYGDIADALAGLLSGTERTDIQVAATVLEATETAADDDLVSLEGENDLPSEQTFGSDIDDRDPYSLLNDTVALGVDHIESEAAGVLAWHGIGNHSSRTTVIENALAEWETTPGRAIALSNGSGTAAIVDATHERWGAELSDNEQDLLAVQLTAAIRDARADSSARVPVSYVEGLESETESKLESVAADQLETTLENATEQGVERATGRALSNFPKGVPVMPPPFPWLVTGNYWSVQVQGEYPRFTVRTPQASPERPGADLVYVRDGSPVHLDVTGDGNPELLGSADRIQFAANTEIVVAVPPGPRGVGDVDGEMSEESAGWPTPGQRRR